METLTLALGARSYPIHIGTGLIKQSELLRPYLQKTSSVAVITNTTIAPLYLETLTQSLDALQIRTIPVILPDGESYKNWETLNLIFDALLAAHCERSTPLLALGGGVIGDMTGFAAACYLRGVPFIQIPSTLLSQVDSSVGGKTAINHPLGKNMIGAFYQPKLVLADIETLRTLPHREFCAGLVEVIKYGLIRDLTFFEWLEAHLDELLQQNPSALQYAIYRSCVHKAEIVAADERETGERALLNLGHTFGHAIEAGLGYGHWLHGEAIAAGTMMAAELSHARGMLSSADLSRIEALFTRVGVPVFGPKLDSATLMALMAHDKKVEQGKMRLILLNRIGEAILSDDASKHEIAAAIQKRQA